MVNENEICMHTCQRYLKTPNARTLNDYVLYNGLNNIKIPNNIAITGEIGLQGKLLLSVS